MFHLVLTFTVFRAATIDFWQARTPKRWPLHRRAGTVFYFSKFSQGPSLGSLASRGGPGITSKLSGFFFQIFVTIPEY